MEHKTEINIKDFYGECFSDSFSKKGSKRKGTPSDEVVVSESTIKSKEDEK